MTAVLATPTPADLTAVLDALRRWQRDDAPIQLHPGDLGWNHRHGAVTLAAATRTWTRDGTIVVAGFLDSPEVFRMTVAPEVWRDDDLARLVTADLADPERGVLPAGEVAVEVPDGTAVQDRLDATGWRTGDAWTPLRLDLAEPPAAPDVAVEEVDAATVAECTAVHRAAWNSEKLTDARFHTLAAGPAWADARCLLARDAAGTPVGTVTVWSAGAGRPGLLEPLGVHPDHRRQGHGRALCLAGARRLRDLGATSLLVCTPSSLVSAVATYEATGFVRLAERLDRVRPART